MNVDASALWVFGIAIVGIGAMLWRPFGWPQFVWPVAASALLVLSGLYQPLAAMKSVFAGTDVYLFLIGMMLLAELAREEGLFDWLAVYATRLAQGSLLRLFVLMYLLGTLVTTFLSNDATAVVLTPAVAAVVRAAKVDKPLPFLFVCAFIANAASFVLPISNPANLVIYAGRMPALYAWLGLYFVPSLAAVAVTLLLHALIARHDLAGSVATGVESAPLGVGGRWVAGGIVGTGLILLVASSLKLDLGLPTALAAVLTLVCVGHKARVGPGTLLRGIAWGVLPLVAGLFVLVGALDARGASHALTGWLEPFSAAHTTGAAWLVGAVLAYGCNLVNNLPAGLLAGHVASSAKLAAPVHSAILLGIDLGPNLSVTGSLATILWLHALKREGLAVGAWDFLKLGAVLMPAALAAALGAVLLLH